MLADGDIPAMISPDPAAAVRRGRQAHRAAVSRLQAGRDRLFQARPASSRSCMSPRSSRRSSTNIPGWRPTWSRRSRQSKQLAYRRIANPRMVPLALVRTAVEEQEAMLGKRPVGLRADARQPQEPRDHPALRPPAGHDRQDRGRSTSCSRTPTSAMPAARRKFDRVEAHSMKRQGHCRSRNASPTIRAGLPSDAARPCLVALHDGAHFIEKPNPVMVLTGFKSLGAGGGAAAIATATATLIVTPRLGCGARGRSCARRRGRPAPTIVVAALRRCSRRRPAEQRSASPACARCRRAIAERDLARRLPQARDPADRLVFDAARSQDRSTRSRTPARRRASPSSATSTCSKSRGRA